ncbi:GNAT family N-acetyltransferase [Candidatus Micrarchaeota archaeon]|nr:GNAT family N-acetyltransferase [Candidatus Micrarchaeota archaeon]
MGGKIEIRKGEAKNAQDFVNLVKELAEFEKLKGPDKDAQHRLIEDGFGKNKKFNILLAFEGKKAVGYAVYFFTYSTFLARSTVYLEDIFVLEETRVKGIGKKLFLACAMEAVKNECNRMEFSVLDWNVNAIKFYEKLGAKRLREWLYYRLDYQDLKKLLEQ